MRRPAAPGRSRWGSCRGRGWGRPQGREDRRLCHSVPWSLPLADRVRPPQGQAQTGPLKLSGWADAPPPGSDKGSRSGQRGLLSPGGRKDTLSDAGEAGADLMEAPRGPDHPGSFRGPSAAGRAWPPTPPCLAPHPPPPLLREAEVGARHGTCSEAAVCVRAHVCMCACACVHVYLCMRVCVCVCRVYCVCMRHVRVPCVYVHVCTRCVCVCVHCACVSELCVCACVCDAGRRARPLHWPRPGAMRIEEQACAPTVPHTWPPRDSQGCGRSPVHAQASASADPLAGIPQAMCLASLSLSLPVCKVQTK